MTLSLICLFFSWRDSTFKCPPSQPTAQLDAADLHLSNQGPSGQEVAIEGHSMPLIRCSSSLTNAEEITAPPALYVSLRQLFAQGNLVSYDVIRLRMKPW